MHGLGWQMDLFFVFILYGFVVPLVINWVAVVVLKPLRKPLWVATGLATHGLALVWVVIAHHEWEMAAGVVLWYIFYLAIVNKKIQKLKHQSDLYARDIKVVQPNELNKR